MPIPLELFPLFGVCIAPILQRRRYILTPIISFPFSVFRLYSFLGQARRAEDPERKSATWFFFKIIFLLHLIEGLL